MSTTFTEHITLEKTSCGRCGGVFALNAETLEYWRNNKGSYHCPYCDSRWSWEESEADRLRKLLAEKERETREAKCESLAARQKLEAAELEASKSRRVRSRVGKGVCPCCNRSFTNLRRHVATKHPEFAK